VIESGSLSALTLYKDEPAESLRMHLANEEFDNPTDSML